MDSDSQSDDFVALLTEHQPAIQAYVITLLPGDPEVMDVVQETNLALWKNRSSFAIGTNFKAWAFAFARNRVTERRRRRAKHWGVHLSDELLDRIGREAEAQGFGDLDRRQSMLRGCLDRLKAKDRELVLYRYSEGSRLQRYAIKEGLSVAALKTKLFRLRVVLKECMERGLRAAAS